MTLEWALEVGRGLLLGVTWDEVYKMTGGNGRALYVNPKAPRAGYMLEVHLILFTLRLTIIHA